LKLSGQQAHNKEAAMSGVWGWFGGQSAQKRKDTPKNAILGLRSQLEMLQKRERHLQNQMDEQDTIARKNVSTNKNGMFMGDTYRRAGYHLRAYT
jgi:hypothetical protein